jgi:PAS domain S-box-containing protein
MSEDTRLAALKRYEILDTAPEVVFDDITRIAAEMCGTPIALISLLDETRQWFKSRQGLDVSETPREIAFCDTAIRDMHIFEVSDARQDPKFRENPLVAGDPHIAHYAGAPLTTPSGENIGTLCVIDRQPGQLSEEQRICLEALARQVVLQLELRQALNETDRAREHLSEEVDRRRQAEKVVRIVNKSLETKVNKRTLELERATSELGHYERRFNSLFENASIGMAVASQDGYIQEVNLAFRELLALEDETILGSHMRDIIEPEDLMEVMRMRELLLKGEKPGYVVEIPVKRADGSKIWVSASVSAINDEDGKPMQTLAMLQSLDDLKRAEGERDRFFNQSVDMFGIIGFDGQVFRVNPAASRILGFSEEVLLDMNFYTLIHPDDLQLAKDALEALSQLDTTEQGNDLPLMDFRLRRQAGDYRLFRFSGASWQEEKRCIVVGRDITETRKAEEAMFQLTTQLQRIREEERKSISREIHDELGQRLTALKIDLSLLQKDLASAGQTQQQQEVGNMTSLVDGTLTAVKRLSQELRPEILDALGLQAAITWQAEELMNRTDVHCELQLESDMPELSEHCKIQLFRIVQESLTNVMRHSKAASVQISLQQTDGRIMLSIGDDGIGFDVKEAEGRSLGMLGMRERARSIRAEFQVSSETGGGSCIRLSMPVEFASAEHPS